MGVAVFFGMLGVTAFGLVMTPVFYVALRGLSGNRPLTYQGAVDTDEGDIAGAVAVSRAGARTASLRRRA